MKNEFSEETRELFFWNHTCWNCGMNDADCLHHIMGRISNSPLNAAPLNNFNCHIGNGELSQFFTRKKLLQRTLKFLKESGYTLTKKDKTFMNKCKQFYEQK